MKSRLRGYALSMVSRSLLCVSTALLIKYKSGRHSNVGNLRDYQMRRKHRNWGHICGTAFAHSCAPLHTGAKCSAYVSLIATRIDLDPLAKLDDEFLTLHVNTALRLSALPRHLEDFGVEWVERNPPIPRLPRGGTRLAGPRTHAVAYLPLAPKKSVLHKDRYEK
jgi:hypothetical protein